MYPPDPRDSCTCAWTCCTREATRSRPCARAPPARAKVMFGLLCATKSAATSDPDMCLCVKSRLEDAIDIFWNDLMVFTETIFEDQRNLTLGHVVGTVAELGELGERPRRFLFRWWRARILVHFLPFDRSVFGMMKDPMWWLFTAVSLVPLYGIRVVFFAVLLALILAGSPPDEYQLVSYIIGFKGSQFVSSGIIQACVAAVKYYLCVHPGGTHTCDVDGPGANQDLGSGLVDFMGSIVLTWVAFLWLPYSSRSAGKREAVDSSEDEEERNMQPTGRCCCAPYDPEKGGRLGGLLGYDVLCFLLSCVFWVTLTFLDASHARPGGQPATPVSVEDMLHDSTTWQGHTAIFWARVFYALLAFPFVVFLIPGLNSILTHTTATGYNANGLCVPYMLRPAPDEPDKDR
mmetsp:Transcript_76875/g.235309  ORF Transcript_76875/g.235309 Transcript_76875/m.235309 type:complete len:404 (-) Transcript_76875:35-1246(-)